VLDARILRPLGDDAFVVGAVGVMEGGYAVAIVRYLADGTLDARFGTGGSTVVPLPGSPGGVAMSAEADGTSLIAAPVDIDPIGCVIAFVRFDANGRLDSTYGDGGRLLVDVGSFPLLLGFQPDGSLLTFDPSDTDATIVRYRADGTRDESFHAARIAGEPVHAVTDGAGNVIVASSVGDAVLVARLTPSGALDATFGGGGTATTSPPGGIFPGRLLLQPDGRILVGGTTRHDPSEFVLLRYRD
jgi:uncharacterized delta-60 repeat protein